MPHSSIHYKVYFSMFSFFQFISVWFSPFQSVSTCYSLFQSFSVRFSLFSSVSHCFSVALYASICHHLFNPFSVGFHLFQSDEKNNQMGWAWMGGPVVFCLKPCPQASFYLTFNDGRIQKISMLGWIGFKINRYYYQGTIVTAVISHKYIPPPMSNWGSCGVPMICLVTRLKVTTKKWHILRKFYFSNFSNKNVFPFHVSRVSGGEAQG